MTSTVLFRHLAYKEICVEQGYLKMLAVQQEYILVQRGYLLVQHDKGQCWQCYIESKNCPPLKHAFFKNKFHPETFLLNTIIVTLKTKAKTTNSSEAVKKLQKLNVSNICNSDQVAFCVAWS